jgi:hypothetical protein
MPFRSAQDFQVVKSTVDASTFLSGMLTIGMDSFTAQVFMSFFSPHLVSTSTGW